jgi:hypothetical protein
VEGAEWLQLGALEAEAQQAVTLRQHHTGSLQRSAAQ